MWVQIVKSYTDYVCLIIDLKIVYYTTLYDEKETLYTFSFYFEECYRGFWLFSQNLISLISNIRSILYPVIKRA